MDEFAMLAREPRVRVITICNSSHADVWKLTSALLPKFVKADSYFVYVPDHEDQLFREITNPQIQVKSQSNLGLGYKSELYNRIFLSENQNRYGWYLQQFFKLEIVFNNDEEFDITVIWDADCVPTRSIEFIDQNGHLIYMETASEAHQPYFDLIRDLIGLQKTIAMSFVIPCFPIYSYMANSLRECIESSGASSAWYNVLLNNINLGLRSGLSETELLGTWVVNKYPSAWRVQAGTWERRGQKRFGYAKRMNPQRVQKLGRKHDLDIISFENWDTRGIKLVIKRMKEYLSFSVSG